jgi:hypothetical protein
MTSNAGGAASQNNALTLTTPSGVTDYTTKTFTVGVGQTVRTSFKLSAVNSNFGAQLSLLQGPIAAQNWSQYANYFTLWSVDAGSGNVQFDFENGGGGNSVTSPAPLQLNTTYSYEISYDSPTSVTGRVYNASNNLLGSFTYSGLSGEPSGFLIDVSNQNSTATFSSVSVTPEPVLFFVSLGAGALIRSRRQFAI